MAEQEAMEIPTFDDWYKAKHRCSFNDDWAFPENHISTYVFALSEAMREYVSEIARMVVKHG
ncbi:hypothetical protein [Pseudomonas nitroreducens]|uniref:hypothetical protein n=1 Tax=Pseudomonas nitroreducens TaxID=46680 RepID=UPI00265AFE1E|nr:hypothetical protein [Pseudomonas nitroreducens]MCP1651669.1 hypothetical protein [Pseudomonas nitroreducens]MCP1684466.1 hypothetical protein [Pseudomonas nitroreducens]